METEVWEEDCLIGEDERDVVGELKRNSDISGYTLLISYTCFEVPVGEFGKGGGWTVREVEGDPRKLSLPSPKSANLKNPSTSSEQTRQIGCHPHTTPKRYSR